MRALLMSLALVATIAGCSGSPEEKTPNSGSNAMNPNSSPNAVFTPNTGTGEDLTADLWGLVCDAAFTCDGVNPELLIVVGRYRNVGDCKANPLPNLDLNTDQIDASVEAGRAQWDSAKAQLCFQEMRDGICEGGGLFETNSTTCDEVIVGLVPAGEPCAWDEECAGGLNCDSGDEDVCYGTCVPNCGMETCGADEFCSFEEEETCMPLGGVGASCFWDGECQSELECGEGDTCQQPAAGGSGITMLDSGAACAFTEDVEAYCRPGTVCTNLTLDGQELAGTCAPPQPAGGVCRLPFECEVGLTCDATTPLEPGTCVAAYADGEECTQDFDCQSFNCDDGRCFTQPAEEICTLP